MNQPEISTDIRPNSNHNDAALRRRSMAVKILAIFELILSIFCLIAGVADVIMTSFAWFCTDFPFLCGAGYTTGQAIWCSVFEGLPFIASVIGITTSKKLTSRQQVRLLMALGIVAAVFMGVLGILELNILTRYTLYIHTGYLILKLCVACVAFINLILFVVSSSLGCCLGCDKCCCTAS